MAIDSSNKRGSAIGTHFPWVPIFPDLDGLPLDTHDRGQLVGYYAGLTAEPPVGRVVPMDEIVELFITIIKNDAELQTLMGLGEPVRWYYQGEGRIALADGQLAFITYTYSQQGSTDSGIGTPILLSMIWAKERARCGRVRSRLIALFDKQTRFTANNLKVRGRFMHEQDGYQTAAKLAGRQAHFRFAYLDN